MRFSEISLKRFVSVLLICGLVLSSVMFSACDRDGNNPSEATETGTGTSETKELPTLEKREYRELPDDQDIAYIFVENGGELQNPFLTTRDPGMYDCATQYDVLAQLVHNSNYEYRMNALLKLATGLCPSLTTMKYSTKTSSGEDMSIELHNRLGEYCYVSVDSVPVWGILENGEIIDLVSQSEEFQDLRGILPGGQDYINGVINSYGQTMGPVNLFEDLLAQFILSFDIENPDVVECPDGRFARYYPPIDGSNVWLAVYAGSAGCVGLFWDHAELVQRNYTTTVDESGNRVPVIDEHLVATIDLDYLPESIFNGAFARDFVNSVNPETSPSAE